MKKEKNTKTIIIAIVSILVIISLISGVTYAFFAVSATSSNYVKGTSAYDPNALSIEVTQVSSGNGLLIPLVDSFIGNATAGIGGKGTCQDPNGNTICKVYSIKITNNSNVKMNIAGTLTLVAKDMPNLKWTKGTGATTGFPTPANTYYSKSDTNLSNDVLEAYGFTGNSKTYYVAIWISEANQAQGDNGIMTGTVEFSAYILDEENNRIPGVTSTFTG